MKKIILSLAIATISLASDKKADAQVSVQLNIGGVFSAAINSAPIMAAPIADAGDYYYYDDINCYYDVANSQYIYPYEGGWYYSNTIPVMYRNYDFRNARRIAMDRRAFQGRNIRPVAFNRQPMMDNDRGFENRRMEQNRIPQQNWNRQPQMQHAVTMNNNSRNMREASHRGRF